MAKCVVCEKTTSGSLEFCQIHYHQFKEEIAEKKPWVRALKNEAQRERRRREKEFDNQSLDEILDGGKYRDNAW